MTDSTFESYVAAIEARMRHYVDNCEPHQRADFDRRVAELRVEMGKIGVPIDEATLKGAMIAMAALTTTVQRAAVAKPDLSGPMSMMEDIISNHENVFCAIWRGTV